MILFPAFCSPSPPVDLSAPFCYSSSPFSALCLTMVVFFLPVVFSWKLWGDKMTCMQKLWGAVIVLTGITGGIIGAIQAINDIANKLK